MGKSQLTQDACHCGESIKSNVIDETLHDFIRPALPVGDIQVELVVLEEGTIGINSLASHVCRYDNPRIRVDSADGENPAYVNRRRSLSTRAPCLPNLLILSEPIAGDGGNGTRGWKLSPKFQVGRVLVEREGEAMGGLGVSVNVKN